LESTDAVRIPIVLRTAAEADVPTPDTDQTTLFMDADDSNAPAYKDDGGTVHPLAGGGRRRPAQLPDHGNTGSTETVDASAGDIHRLVANAATVTLTLTGCARVGHALHLRLYLVPGRHGRPRLGLPGKRDVRRRRRARLDPSGANALDLVDLTTLDGGTTYYAVVVGRPGAAGSAGSNGTNGTNGTAGGAITIPYTFSTTTTDSDPGSGNLRLDNATQTSATKIRADLNGSDGTTWTTVIDSLDDSTNTIKGHIRLFKTSDPTKWLLFTVSAVDSSSGYRNITVANVAGSASSPFSNGDAITLAFTRTGDVGASGTASVGTDPIYDAKGDLPAGTGADTAAKVPVGANGKVLTADSTQTTGLKYTTPPGTLIGLTVYGGEGVGAASFGTSSATQADVSAANLSTTFVVPESGNILYRVTALMHSDTASKAGYIGIRESTTNIITNEQVWYNSTSYYSISRTLYVTGLTPGASLTYKLAFATDTVANFSILYGNGNGPITIEVIAAP
jgi:hypothetical protein